MYDAVLWAEGRPPAVREPLGGAARADVAVIGGGYVGLWTALRIKELEPSCEVAVLERDVCGAGASGRNAGFVLTWWPKIGALATTCGTDGALRLARASEDALDDLEAFCHAHAPAAQLDRGGWLWTASSEAQVGAWRETLELCSALGAAPFVELPADEVIARTGSPVHRAGVFAPTAASVNPLALVRALARAAESRGVRVYEHSAVLGRHTRSTTLVTARGTLSADRIVIATGAWASGLPELRRQIVVISSDMIATVPVPDRVEGIGGRGVCVSDSQLQVEYHRTTSDGRVVFGKGGWAIDLGGRVRATAATSPRRTKAVVSGFRRIYPQLADVPLAAAWAGPVDRTPTGLPAFGRLGGTPTVVYGVGFGGNGVGPSLVGGRILASLALERDDEWTSLPLVDRTLERFPPEPIRYLGAHLVRAAVIRKERSENSGRRPTRLAGALAALAPGGLTPTKDRPRPQRSP